MRYNITFQLNILLVTLGVLITFPLHARQNKGNNYCHIPIEKKLYINTHVNSFF